MFIFEFSEHVVTLNKIPTNSTSSADLEIAEQASTPLEDTPKTLQEKTDLDSTPSSNRKRVEVTGSAQRKKAREDVGNLIGLLKGPKTFLQLHLRSTLQTRTC